MSKKDSRVKSTPTAQSSTRRRSVVVVTLALVCILGTGILAQVTTRKKGKSAMGEVSVESFAPASPSKELRSAGTRLVTTEEPCNGADSQSPIFTNISPTVGVAPPSRCPYATTGQANYAIPAASDNCPGVTVTCNPPPGSTFAVGTTTTVVCTASDSSHNIATCSFQLTMFSACLVDDTNNGNSVMFNATTGDFQFCRNGVTIATDRGTVTSSGCNITIDNVKGDRTVHITANSTGQGTGSAFVHYTNTLPNNCSISDSVMSGDVCTCH